MLISSTLLFCFHLSFLFVHPVLVILFSLKQYQIRNIQKLTKKCFWRKFPLESHSVLRSELETRPGLKYWIGLGSHWVEESLKVYPLFLSWFVLVCQDNRIMRINAEVLDKVLSQPEKPFSLDEDGWMNESLLFQTFDEDPTKGSSDLESNYERNICAKTNNNTFCLNVSRYWWSRYCQKSLIDEWTFSFVFFS